MNLQKVPTSNTEGGWSFSLAEYVRHNDMPIYEASERVLRAFQDELMPAESLSEFFDVVGQYTCLSLKDRFIVFQVCPRFFFFFYFLLLQVFK